ncbi:amidase [Kitasatospora sp. NBC_00240]|uniref:amidase n=1 Tax=Kitasatospora sp. NBC_00240 TaxID=2903567 RepID=UPI00225A72B9|nr:amidase [Kitasatospora sp. NBC_00240]MCX5214496.1 amidase [Kitasatospora sp. NBC_00240]
MTGWTGRTAMEIAEAVRGRRVTPREVVAEHLALIERIDPQIGAFRKVLGERALRDADALAGHPDLAALPLAGVPVAVKDNLAVAGEATRNGSAATSDAPAADDHETVRRLRAAGAVVVGLTSVPELCVFGTTDSVFGTTRSPWDLARSAGGSSGGSAAAVAAAMVPIVVGNDGMGSIRIPAANCGVLGLKPGHGVVPAGLGVDGWSRMAENGPIATCVADARLLLAVLGGAAAGSGAAPADGPAAAAPGDGSPLRVALSVRCPTRGIGVAADRTAAVRDTGRHLAAAGHRVTAAEAPYPFWLGAASVARWLAGTAADARGLDPALLAPRTRRHVALGRAVTRAGLVRPAQRTRWQDRMERFFVHHDVLVTPALARVPPPAVSWHTRGWAANVLSNIRYAPFSHPWNLARWPALVLPVPSQAPGPASGGLPASVQLVAPPGGEELLLALAAERPLGPAPPPPDAPPAGARARCTPPQGQAGAKVRRSWATSSSGSAGWQRAPR